MFCTASSASVRATAPRRLGADAPQAAAAPPVDSAKLRCCCDGWADQLGYGNTASIGKMPGDKPPPDVPLGAPVKQIFAHQGRQTSVVLADDSLRCWGLNGYGRLGLDHTKAVGDDETPNTVPTIPHWPDRQKNARHLPTRMSHTG
ncbi:MAG TPA: RCC1 domain-containing protein [Nannocystis sp.]